LINKPVLSTNYLAGFCAAQAASAVLFAVMVGSTIFTSAMVLTDVRPFVFKHAM
jgi:hypothetical protein